MPDPLSSAPSLIDRIKTLEQQAPTPLDPGLLVDRLAAAVERLVALGEAGPAIKPLLLTAKQVGELLGCSASHVWRLDAAAKIPTPHRIGGATRWNRETLERWAAAGCPEREQFQAMEAANIRLAERKRGA